MPPLESPTDSKRHQQPPRKQLSRSTDWTTALLQQRNLAPENKNSTNSMVESTIASSPPKMRRNQTDPSLIETAMASSAGSAKRNCKNSAPSAKRKRSLSRSLPVFLYTVVLSVLLMGYTEFQLWQMSGTVEQSQSHGIAAIASQNNQTQPVRLRTASAVVNGNQTSSPDSILHIIHSRFMQNQPNLLQLGEARLHLFRRFFLASLQQQSSRNFCVIVRTDPQLDPVLKQGLIAALQDFNVTHILVASNEIPKSQYQDVASGIIKPSDVWSGSLQDVREYLGLNSQQAKRGESTVAPPRVIETRLDADDGLHSYFVDTLHSEANDNYQFQQKTWRLWCVASHAEWQYQSIWKKPPPEDDPGSIVALQVNYCVTPGLSVAFLGDQASIETMPSTMNHEKLLQTRLCSKDPKHPNKTFKTDCRAFVPMIMGALRARTPTSAGMLNLVYNGTSMNHKYIEGAAKQKDVQGQLWWAVRNFFGFSKEDARSVNQYLNGHMKMIARENLLGQCTRGHSCKNSSQIILQSIVDGSS